MDRDTKLLPLIATFKLLKALSLFALALGLHHLRHGNVETILLDWCRAIRVDPDDKFAHLFISKVTGLPTSRLHELGVGVFLYGMLFATEGAGLLLKQKWAEYLTVVSTITFLPLEIYELIYRPNRKLVKAVVLVINVAILIYLIINLRRKQQSDTQSLTELAVKS